MGTLISRREPVVTLKPFRYLNRGYVEGDILNRQKTRMSSRKLSQLIRHGFVMLACNMDPAELARYGFIYDAGASRQKLAKVPGDIDENEESASILHDRGRGWYDVVVDGEVVNSEAMRKKEAERFAKEYLGR